MPSRIAAAFRPSAIICALLAALFPVHPGAAQCGPSISGRFGGETTAVAQFEPNCLLVARGTYLEVLDLANPHAPAPFSQVRRLPLAVPARKISVTPLSTHAFVLLENGDVVRVDLLYSPRLDIANPVTIPGDSSVVDIQAEGNRVYVARLDEDYFSIHSSIRVYNIGPTGGIQQVSQITPFLNNYGFDRLALIGSTLWCGMHEFESTIFGVEGYDLSNPAVPVRVTTSLNNIPFGIYARVTAMQAIGNKLLLSHRYPDPISDDDRLRAVDVSIPSNPVWRPPVDFDGDVGNMAAAGNLLRVTKRYPPAVTIWNTSNPSELDLDTVFPTPYAEVKQIVAGPSIDYWAAGRGGLITMNVGNPNNPIVLSVLNNSSAGPAGPNRVRQRGNTTAVTDYDLNALYLYDYTLPPAQQLRSVIGLPEFSNPALMELGFLDGTGQVLACVATYSQYSGYDRIFVIDITNPTAPAILSTIPDVDAYLMSVTDSRLYVLASGHEFRIYELAQPLSPQLRSSTVFGSGNYTCMTSWGNAGAKAVALGSNPFGLWLINTTDAVNPQVSGIYNPVTNYYPTALAKSPNYLWVSSLIDSTAPPHDQASRLESLIVTNLTTPTRRYLSSSTSGAGEYGYIDALAFVSNSAGNFLLGTPTPLDHNDSINNRVLIWELLPFLFATNEAVAYPIAQMNLPYTGGVGTIAPSADGSRVLFSADHAGLFQVAMPTQWEPGFAIQPLTPPSVCYGASASFFAFASGNPSAVTYQWYRGSVPLTNGPTGWGSTISGATDAGLTIESVRPMDALNYYYAVATNTCGSTVSRLSFIDLCPGDFNCSGAATIHDFFDFLTAWFVGDPRADFDGSGAATISDVFLFLAAWFTFCY